MYSRIAKAKQRKIRNIIVSVLGATLSLAMIILLIPKIELFSDTFTTRAEAEVVKATSTSFSSTLNETSISTISSESSSVEVSEVSEEPAIEEVYTESEEPVGEETTVTESAVYMTDSEVADTTTSNGNTAVLSVQQLQRKWQRQQVFLNQLGKQLLHANLTVIQM